MKILFIISLLIITSKCKSQDYCQDFPTKEWNSASIIGKNTIIEDLKKCNRVQPNIYVNLVFYYIDNNIIELKNHIIEYLLIDSIKPHGDNLSLVSYWLGYRERDRKLKEENKLIFLNSLRALIIYKNKKLVMWDWDEIRKFKKEIEKKNKKSYSESEVKITLENYILTGNNDIEAFKDMFLYADNIDLNILNKSFKCLDINQSNRLKAINILGDLK